MKNLRFIVSDLDGTLLNDKKQISEYSISILRQARSKGIQVCFASGRYEPMISLYTKLVGDVDYLISSNGALVRDVSTNSILRCNTLPEESLISLLEFLREKKISFVMYSPDCAFYWQPRINVTKRMEEYEQLACRAGVAVTIPRQPVDFENISASIKNILKVVVYEDRQSYMDCVADYLSNRRDLCFESTGENLLGIFNNLVSKKTALEGIMNKLNIGKDQIVVFGDDVNDISMFECANIKVAVKNAAEELKERASFLTASNNEDGVAKFIDVLLK